jgi:hypothetical protein
MTRSFNAVAWGVSAGVAACFGCTVFGMLTRMRPPFMVYVWPSSLLLMLAPGDKHPVAFSIMLVVSVALNALLYSALFFAAYFLRRRLRRQRSDV